QFRCLGQPAKPQQVTGFFKRGLLREFVDINAAISEYSGFAIDVANSRTGRNYAFKTFCNCAGRHDFPDAVFWLLKCWKRLGAQHFFILQILPTFQPRPETEVTVRTTGARRTRVSLCPAEAYRPSPVWSVTQVTGNIALT